MARRRRRSVRRPRARVPPLPEARRRAPRRPHGHLAGGGPAHELAREEAANVARTIWALGDYHRFAKELVWEFGPILIEACGIRPGQLPPILWGDEDHVRELFGDRTASLELTRRQYVERLSSRPATPQDYVDFNKENFGPVVAIYAGLADQPEQISALDQEVLDLATRWNRGTPDVAEYHYDYLLVVARKRDA